MEQDESVQVYTSQQSISQAMARRTTIGTSAALENLYFHALHALETNLDATCHRPISDIMITVRVECKAVREDDHEPHLRRDT